MAAEYDDLKSFNATARAFFMHMDMMAAYY
jgi:hypothetical protein